MMERMKAKEAECFNLPLEVKKKYEMAETDVEGFGNAFVISEEQKLDWSDGFSLIVYPPEIRNLKKWPLIVPGFRYIIYAVSWVK